MVIKSLYAIFGGLHKKSLQRENMKLFKALSPFLVKERNTAELWR